MAFDRQTIGARLSAPQDAPRTRGPWNSRERFGVWWPSAALDGALFKPIYTTTFHSILSVCGYSKTATGGLRHERRG
jgi:hypothetical protein